MGESSEHHATGGAAYVRVALPLPLPAAGAREEGYTYAVPESLRGRLQPGHAVWVPFGPRKLTGWVLELLPEPDLDPSRIRAVERLLDPRPVADAVQLRFLRWAADYYLASLGEMLATALPGAARSRTRLVFVPEPDASDALLHDRVLEPHATVLREVIRRPGTTARGLQRRLDGEVEAEQVRRALEALRRAGHVRGTWREVGGTRDRVRTVQLRLPADDLLVHAPRAGARMREVVARLQAAGGQLDLPDLLDDVGTYARSAVDRLEKVGVLKTWSRERRDPVTAGELDGASREPLPPNEHQERALRALLAGEHPVYLLHGVTGSGKTEVYLQAAARVLERGQQVLVLVPEIGLTPQLTGRFRARFGERVAVLHSGLTGAQRLREWRRVRAGDAEVAVGARSALFAPFRDLGLIVVDEEHDDSYKQDEGVRYHARDLAVVRGRFARCPVVLGSATPALESVANAQAGRYHEITLPERATPRAVPRVETVDMNAEPRVGGRVPVLSARLQEVVRGAIERGGKAILLYNRRGYATVVQCPDCGGRFECPSCGISLVLHKRARILSCHYCGFRLPRPGRCPQCGGGLEELGLGSEQVEETVQQAFPDVNTVRMDADTTRARGAHHRILDAFRGPEVQLLVGTQLVAKGHDFPDVEVAAVVGLDHVLNLPDFRSAERTWALVNQLAGRAGRGDAPGTVVLQTHHPDHFVFRNLHDPETFCREELRVRRTLGYPPYTRLVMLRIEAANERTARSVAEDLARRMRDRRPPNRTVDVLGPAPAPLARLVGRWRFQVVLRGRDPAAFRAWLREQREPLRGSTRRGVRVSVDVDPRSLL